MSIHDDELVRLVQSGDKQAFDLLVQKYQFKIASLVTRYIKDPTEALDITQESLLKAYEAMENFRGDSAFYTWLYRIAINTAKNHMVIQNRRMVQADLENMDIENTMIKTHSVEFMAPEYHMIKDELESVILGVIEHLPPDLRTAITLREMDGLTYHEIAGVMACPIGTVRSRIFRAREAIEREIRPILKKTQN